MTNKELKKWLKRCGSTDSLCDGCPCLSPDDSKKYARCKYYKPNTAEE